MAGVELKPLPFNEAIEFFRQKGYRLSPNSWRDVWAAEHVHAFTVARVTSMDVLESIRSEVDRAIADGVSLNEFKSSLSEILERKGWLGKAGIAPWRLEVIYRTNVQAAYQAGRYKQMLEVADRRPYWMYDAVNDSRTRPSHLIHDGVVRRFDHPFWNEWYPPNGFNCRCTVRTLSERQMRSRGLKEETRGTNFRPDPGFDYNPGLERWKPDLSKYTPQARRILTRAGASPQPADIPALAERLSRLRDGLRETGIATSSRPIRLIEDRSTPYYAWARYQTGEIGLRAEIYRTIRRALRTGKAMSEAEVNAFEILVHEFGHHLGHPIDLARYQTDMAYYALTQAINDLWARHHTGHVLGSMGIRYDGRLAARLVDNHPSGYQTWVERLRNILRAAGFDEAEQKALVAEMNLTVRTEGFSARMWEALRRKKPALTADYNFGEVLTKVRRYDALLEELRK